MTESASGRPGTEDLIRRFGSDDLTVRREARETLARRGSEVVPTLAQALAHADEGVRWEAAKTLSVNADPLAIPALIGALEDENGGVRWLAAESLVRIGEPSVVPLLRELISKSDSPWFRNGAHHVLKSLVVPDTSKLVHALEGRFPELSVPVLANEALGKLEG